MRDLRNQTLRIVRENYNRALRQASNVTRASGAREPHRLSVPAAPRCVEIAKAVDLRRAQKADVHAALLQQSHHRNHIPAIRSLKQIRRISHGVQKSRGRLFADDPVLKSPVARGACVRLASANAIIGNRIPTNTSSPSRISRAAADTINSPLE